MLRLFKRLPSKRWVRTTGVATFLAAVWFVWWMLPERPLREVRISGRSPYGVEIAPDGRTAVCTIGWGSKDERTEIILLSKAHGDLSTQGVNDFCVHKSIPAAPVEGDVSALAAESLAQANLWFELPNAGRYFKVTEWPGNGWSATTWIMCDNKTHEEIARGEGAPGLPHIPEI